MQPSEGSTTLSVEVPPLPVPVRLGPVALIISDSTCGANYMRMSTMMYSTTNGGTLLHSSAKMTLPSVLEALEAMVSMP